MIWKASGLFADTSLSREASRNWALSMKRSWPREKLMYFSVLLGMQLTWPSNFEIACISRWKSYPRRLWKTTGIVVFFSRSLRLQVLCAAPLNRPAMWQWSRTESPSRGLSHTWHMVAVLYARQSSRVILMALGLASTPLILCSSSCSACRKCSAAFWPRYSTGTSVWPSHRTTM